MIYQYYMDPLTSYISKSDNLLFFSFIPLIPKIISIPLLLLFAFSSFGQFHGRCLDAQTGKPVKDAQIISEGKRLATSNTSGHFSFDDSSVKTVIVKHPDYKTMQENLIPGEQNIFLLTPDSRQIDEVTVSAPLLNTLSKKVPGGFSLISSDSLQPNLSAIDVIEQSPGVVMQKGALNTGRVMIRGIGSRSPSATTRIRAYPDEIPLKSGDGHTTVEDLEMYNTVRTEIVRGPASAHYGSGLGGIIVFHPDHSQASPLALDALTQYRPFDQKKILLNGGFRQKRTIIESNAAYTQTTGFRENNDYLRWNGQFMLRHHFGNHALFFLTNYIHLNAQIPSSIDEETYHHSPQKAAENWQEIKGFEKYDNYPGAPRNAWVRIIIKFRDK
jgi:iron complex outermembrane receptor protein